MAGLGAKLFTAFSKLTAADVNGYLADQSIMRFASTAARDAAFGGAGEPTLAEGMTCYLDDTNVLQSYTGSAWVTLTSSINPPALELVSGVTCSSGGTAANGIVTIGSAVSSVTVTDAFSATYDNYKIIISGGTGSANSEINMRLGSVTSGYYSSYIFTSWNNTVSADSSKIAIRFQYVGGMGTDGIQANIEVNSPFLAKNTRTFSGGFGDTGNYVGYASGLYPFTTSFTSFQIAPSAGTMTGATIRVYGYRNQL
jgi:hypothetical protein